jgi:predicted acetyltransferase/ketosteroid isomerase-like protein
LPELLAPDARLRQSFAHALREFLDEGRGTEDDHSAIGRYLRDGAPQLDEEAFARFVDAVRGERLEETPRPEGYVPATELWWVEGDEFLGRIGIRHRLTPVLLEMGGHIGYDVRPSARRRGHATEMLRQGLTIANELGIDPALITCDVDNVGSRAVIERNGGVLEDERNGKLRFWARTAQAGRLEGSRLETTRANPARRAGSLARVLGLSAALVVVLFALTALEQPPNDPLSVVQAWEAARNAGDVDRAMSMMSETATIFGTTARTPAGRAWLRSVLAAQAIAGHTVHDSDCVVSGASVTCRYVQADAFFERCGLTLTGEHRFQVLAGKVVFASRRHDEGSREAVYGAVEAFRSWVATVEPAEELVIWSDPNSIFYSTPEGARAMLALLDRYDCRGRTSAMASSNMTGRS